VVAATVLAFAGGIPSAHAGVDCDYSGTTAIMNVVFNDNVIVGRSGDDLTINGTLCEVEPGVATVTTTGLIDLYDNFGGAQIVTFDLTNGPFQPGLEGGATSEIDLETTATGNQCDVIRVVGTGDDDHLRWGTQDGIEWVNLNADETEDIDGDLHVEVGCIKAKAVGGVGADEISAAGGLGTGTTGRFRALFSGGDGPDVLTGGVFGDVLKGDAGADVLSGGNLGDALNGGLGNDRVGGGIGHDTLKGAEGRDLLVAGDGNDVLDGGPGIDTCRGGTGDDTFISCEHRSG
jgi:Ca2+-binding RTX toxin-like protein